MTCGAAASTAMVAMMVNMEKVIRQMRSSTMAANFQSFSMLAASSSFLTLSLITRISFRMLTSSRWIPEWAKLSPKSCKVVEDLPNECNAIRRCFTIERTISRSRQQFQSNKRLPISILVGQQNWKSWSQKCTMDYDVFSQ